MRAIEAARAPGAGSAFLSCCVVMASRPHVGTPNSGKRNYGTRSLAAQRAKFSSQVVPTAQRSGFLAPPVLDRPAGDFLLMTDIDGTLCGDDDALQELNNYWLSEHVSGKRTSLLAYSTGRELPSYMKLCEQVASRGIEIMRPDILVTCDGTQVWWFSDDSDEPQPDLTWASQLEAGWDRGVVRSAFRKNIDQSQQAEMAMGQHGYVLDAREKPAEHEPYRFSCAVRTEEQARRSVERIADEIAAHQALDVHVFYNAGGPNNSFWVAALPAAAPSKAKQTLRATVAAVCDTKTSAGGKGNALRYVLEQLGMESTQAVCCGDSGNDAPMFDFQRVGVRGIVVNNAFHDLKSYCQAVEVQGEPVHFFASRPAAGGIIEGLMRIFN